MENLERCPRCFQNPVLDFETNGEGYTFVLSCPKHGHMAMGNTLDQVQRNWNMYLLLLEKAA